MLFHTEHDQTKCRIEEYDADRENSRKAEGTGNDENNNRKKEKVHKVIKT